MITLVWWEWLSSLEIVKMISNQLLQFWMGGLNIRTGTFARVWLNHVRRHQMYLVKEAVNKGVHKGNPNILSDIQAKEIPRSYTDNALQMQVNWYKYLLLQYLRLSIHLVWDRNWCFSERISCWTWSVPWPSSPSSIIAFSSRACCVAIPSEHGEIDAHCGIPSVRFPRTPLPPTNHIALTNTARDGNVITLTSLPDGKGHAGKELQHSQTGGYELLS